MAKPTAGERIAELPDAVNNMPWLVRLGQHCTLTFVLEVDAASYFLDVRNGNVVNLRSGPYLLRSYSFAIRGTEAAWTTFWRALPPRGFHDLFAMTTYGHFTVDGDLAPLLKHLPYIKGLLASVREQRDDADLATDFSGAGA